MLHNASPFRIHAIMLAIGALGSWGLAQAQTVTTVINSVGSNTTATTQQDVVSVPPDNFASSYQFRDADPGTNGASIVSTFAHANDTGSFGTSVFGTGLFDARAEFSYSRSITNTSTLAQSASFSFYIYSGSVEADGADADGEYARSSVSFLIRLDGSTAWSSSASVDLTAGAYNNSFTGIDIYEESTQGYSITGGRYTVDLGVLQPNQTVLLSYDMFTTGASNAAGTWIDDGSSGYGYGGYGGYGYGGFLEGAGYAAARSADPFDINWGPGNVGAFDPIDVNFTAVVPEPETYAMMLMALGVLGAAARRRRTR